MGALGLLLVVGLLMISSVYAVLIQLNSADVAQIGGTGQVSVSCPASGCTISKVSWILDSNPPFKITGAEVSWTPSDSGATYKVYVVVYDSGSTAIASGSATQAGDTNEVTTSVSFDTAVDAKDIYSVEVIIAEQ